MKSLVVVFIFLFVQSVCGQPSSSVPTNIRASNTLDRLSAGPLGSDDVLYGIPLPPGRVIGDTYLNMEWRKATIMLYDKDKLIEGYPVRYDIKTDEMEIKAPNGVKVLQGSKIRSFVWMDTLTNAPTYFVNAKEYVTEDNSVLTGFMQVISDGTLTALARTSLAIKKADYVVQFDVGNRDDTILKRKNFYYATGNTLFEMPSNKKKLLSIFGSKAGEVERFMKINSLNIKNENHVRAVFDHYNSLVK